MNLNTELDPTTLPAQIETPGVLVVDWRSLGRPKKLARDRLIGRVAASNPDVRFASIDVDRQGLLADQWGVEDPPEVMVFRDGVLLFRAPGALKQEDLTGLVRAAFAADMAQVRTRINGQRGHAVFVGPNAKVELGKHLGADPGLIR